jgi:broad specificity phosphatase PhoE
MEQLWLVRHGPTTATQRRAFGADEPLLIDARGRAARLGECLPSSARTLCSPALRCRETAAAAGLDPQVDIGLDQVDIGRWRGQSFAGIHSSEPRQMAAWLDDPGAAPHGGESLAAFACRVATWLDDLRGAAESVLVAVTHSETIRAAVLHALGAPLRAFWQLEAAPLSITELHLHGDRWSVTRVNWSATE